MMTMLISIQPKFVKEILNGNKKWEYRKTNPKFITKKILIYETAPAKKVVAEARVGIVFKDKPSEVYRATSKDGGVSKEFFDKYFKDKQYAIAYELIDIKVFAIPFELSEIDIKQPPQSYMYIWTKNQFNLIEKLKMRSNTNEKISKDSL